MLKRNDRYKFWTRVNTLVEVGGKWAMAKQVMASQGPLSQVDFLPPGKSIGKGQRKRESEKQVAAKVKVKKPQSGGCQKGATHLCKHKVTLKRKLFHEALWGLVLPHLNKSHYQLLFTNIHPNLPRRTVCDGTHNFKRYRYRYFFPVPNIFDTDTGTFFGTNFFRYRFRDFFPIPNFSDTGSDTT